MLGHGLVHGDPVGPALDLIRGPPDEASSVSRLSPAHPGEHAVEIPAFREFALKGNPLAGSLAGGNG